MVRTLGFYCQGPGFQSPIRETKIPNKERDTQGECHVMTEAEFPNNAAENRRMQGTDGHH